MLKIYLVLVNVMILVTPGFAAYAPPDNHILPKYMVKKVSLNKLILSHNLSVDLSDIRTSWSNPEYSGIDNLSDLRCGEGDTYTNKKIVCNENYLLKFNEEFSIDDHEDCESRRAVVLVDKKTGSEVLLNKKLSTCMEIRGFIKAYGSIWLASYWRGGHGSYTGDSLVRIKIDSGEIEFVSEYMSSEENGRQYFWKNHWGDTQIFSVAYDASENSLWITSTLGFHRYDLKSKKLTTYYQYLFLDEQNVIRVGLSDERPKDNLELFIHLTYFKIIDKAGFSKIWPQTENSRASNPRMHQLLMPYYIESLKYYGDTNNDSYMFRTLAGSILKFDQQKYAPQLEKIYPDLKYLKLKSALRDIFQRADYPFVEPSEANLEDDYLNSFVQGKKKAWELCSFYRSNRTSIDDINFHVLNKTRSRLYEVLRSCIDEKLWDFSDRATEEFLFKLYAQGYLESKEAICRFLSGTRQDFLGNKFLEKVVLDLPVFRKKYGRKYNQHRCISWLLNSVTTDEKIAFIQDIGKKNRIFQYELVDLFSALQRRRDFPIFKQQTEQRRKHDEDNCRRQRKSETLDEFVKRCGHRQKVFRSNMSRQEALRLLPPPPKDGKPVNIDMSRDKPVMK